MRGKRIVALLLAMIMAVGLFLCPAYAADGNPSYVFTGSYNEQSGIYELVISVDQVEALTGRIGIVFDTKKVKLVGDSDLSAFSLEKGINAVAEVLPADKMVSVEGGYACLAWYANGVVNALSEKKTIATLKFTLADGVSPADFDAATFRLRYIDAENFDPWKTPASINGKAPLAPVRYEYLSETGNPCDVQFLYDGADRAPEDGYSVTLLCKSMLGDPVTASLEMNGQTYHADEKGEIVLQLGEGEYLYRLSAVGFGAQRGKLTVPEQLNPEFIFVNDETLVRQAAEELEIGYSAGDSAERVTEALTLKDKTDTGVSIRWESDHSNIVTSIGLVFLPAERTEVNLTATLTKGSATETKNFRVTVYSKEDLRQEQAKADKEIIDQVAETLEIGFQKGDDSEHVTKVLSLPTNNTSGVTITWSSSDPAVITASGAVYRPARNTDVVLTAALSKGDVTSTKSFHVTVIGTGEPIGPVDPKPQPEPGDKFTDIAAYVWAKDAIYNLAKEGIINGVTETTFEPAANIKRGDFVLMLARMLDLKGTPGEGFADVAQDSYYYEAITLAKSLEIIGGVGDNRFEPDRPISRQEMMTIVTRALRKTEWTKLSAPAELSGYADSDSIADYAREPVAIMVGSGFIAGDDQNCINPLQNTTRAETAVFLNRVLLKKGK